MTADPRDVRDAELAARVFAKRLEDHTPRKDDDPVGHLRNTTLVQAWRFIAFQMDTLATELEQGAEVTS